MNSVNRCRYLNSIGGVTPYIKHYGDEYFEKGWFKYKPIEGPDGKIGSGSMVESPRFKTKRGDIVTRRGTEYLIGWGAIAGNLTYTDDFNASLNTVMKQDNIQGVFWVEEETQEVVALWFKDDSED